MKKLVLAAIFGVVFFCTDASALDFDFSINLRKDKHRRGHRCREVYDHGHWETRVVRVMVCPERLERIHHDPIYRIEIDSCGREIKILVKEGWCEIVIRPAEYQDRIVRVWVSGP